MLIQCSEMILFHVKENHKNSDVSFLKDVYQMSVYRAFTLPANWTIMSNTQSLSILVFASEEIHFVPLPLLQLF